MKKTGTSVRKKLLTRTSWNNINGTKIKKFSKNEKDQQILVFTSRELLAAMTKVLFLAKKLGTSFCFQQIMKIF